MPETQASLAYTLRFPARRQNLLDVEVDLPSAGGAEQTLFLPAWTPGSYLIREYARNIEGVEARSPRGGRLEVRKVSKARWVIETGGSARITVSYRVWAHEMSVRTNWVDEDFALIVGAATFLSPVPGDAPERGPGGTIRLRVELPESWAGCWTSLSEIAEPEGPSPAGSSRRLVYGAPDHDTLVDSPLLLGNPDVREFEVGGRRHFLVTEGHEGVWDPERAARDLEAIVGEQQRFWRTVPYERYLFLNLLTGGRGGLEHSTCSVLMGSRWSSRGRKPWIEWISLASHEFFHAWNVKRLRPVELGPFDYEKEVYTRSLWVAEGITNYYTDLLVHRAGLIERKEYLKRLSKFFERMRETPGRLVQSLQEASFDAWIKLYRPDENSVNTTVSYYVKGAVVAFLLDARIRRLTAGARSLDDVVRRAYDRFSGDHGFTPGEFREVIEEVAERDFGRWLETALVSTEDLDPSDALDWLGLRVHPKESAEAEEEESPARPGWLGVRTADREGRLIARQVLRSTPAAEAGIDPGDELVAIEGFRLTPGTFQERLERFGPGARVRLLVSRREKLRELEATLGEEPPKHWRLEPSPDATAVQIEHLDAWLGGPDRKTEGKRRRE